MTTMSSHERALHYGWQESNPIEDAEYTAADLTNEIVHISDPRLVRVDRLRLLGGGGVPGFDISYCWGTLRNGDHVRVDLDDTYRLPNLWKTELVNICKRNRRHAKSLGLLTNVSIFR